MKNSYAKTIAKIGITAGLYTASTLLVFPIASGVVQIRVSEALCLLPLIFFEAVPGLFIGCLLSNIITGCAPFDVILGSLITLFAGVFTYIMGKTVKKTALKIFIGGFFPVLMNAFLLPLIWLLYGAGEQAYMVQVAFLTIGQTVSVYALGTPLYLKLNSLKKKGKLF